MSLNPGFDVSRRNQDLQHAGLLFSLLIAVPLVWMIFLGWQFTEVIPQGDFLRSTLHHFRELTRVDGDWEQMLYWTGLGGGVKVHDVIGTLPLSQFLAWMGLPAYMMGNIQVMVVQALFAYFCTRCSIELCRVVYEVEPEDSISLLILLGLLFGFLPVLGWRIAEGHETIIAGLFVLLVFTLLYLREMRGDRSLFELLLSFVVLCHVFQCNAYQTAYYSVVLGAPIVIGYAFAGRAASYSTIALRTLVPATIFMAALLVSLPKIFGTLLNAFGDDVGRVASARVIYSYSVASWQDWIGSLPWSAGLIPGERPDFLHHETNYPAGALVLLLFCAAGVLRWRFVAAGLLASLILVLVVSMNIAPASEILLAVVPMLESFRVPARAMLIPVVFASIFAIASLLQRFPVSDDRSFRQLQFVALAILVFSVAAFIPAWILDVVLLALAVTLVAWRKATPAWILPVVVALFAGGSVSGFSERAAPPRPVPLTSDAVIAMQEMIVAEAPALESPLNRAFLPFEVPELGSNTGFGIGISSMTHYWIGMHRYARLHKALNEEPYNPTHYSYAHAPIFPNFQAISRLYNVGWQVQVRDTSLGAVRAFDTFGAAWLSSRVSWYDSWSDLANAVTATQSGESLLLLEVDPATSSLSRSEQICRIIDQPTVAQAVSFPYRFDLNVEGTCYMTVAMNYTGILKVVDQKGEPLPTFPAYGALLGVMVNSDTRQVSIEPVPTMPPGAMIYLITGFLLLLGLCWLALVKPPRPAVVNKA